MQRKIVDERKRLICMQEFCIERDIRGIWDCSALRFFSQTILAPRTKLEKKEWSCEST